MNSAIALNAAATGIAGKRVSTRIRQLAERTLWVNVAPDGNGVHNFTPALVGEFQDLIDEMRIPAAVAGAIGHPPPYAVIQSSHPTYFSQGGDLRFFLGCIQRRDADRLRDYSMRCLDAIVAWSTDFKPAMTTISLVQGRALGGGFELALSADHIVAEEQSTFGFPEIMFGLFPCSGAMGLLCERITPKAAERLMTNKKIYTAAQLLEMGLVDEVVPQGAGELAVERFVREHASRRKARMMVRQAVRRAAGIDYAEGRQVVEDWVETAMQLSADEVRAMEMLILMQDGETRPQEQAVARVA
ncbi:MAG TPA: crotonase/enoyl-CoA hydratase family protein [Luteimonas sp.]|nr:crotonase/enoyl-CoA hydratase family protein [Luteimonas sp.]HRO27571.1 crotonase/enoyl-CoA hydratase family protein [Luteimonas sp.]